MVDDASPQHLRAQRWAGLLFTVLLFLAVLPLLGWMVLAIWTADLSRPRFEKVAKALGGHARAAGAITAALVVLVLAPVTAVGIVLADNAIDFAKQAMAQGSVEDALHSIVGGSGEAVSPSLTRAADLLRSHGQEAATAALRVLGATFAGLFGLFVFGVTLFGAYVDAPRITAFLAGVSPLGVPATRRMGLAFRETGRGLFIGIGLTCAAQATLSIIGYAVAGVPRFMMLGALTFFAALIPGVGLALVWIPVCAALALTHHTNAAIGIALYHMFVVGMADNFLRPVFAKMGKLDLSGAALMLAIIGGMTVFGAWGIVFGPLLLRLTIEALRIVGDQPSAHP
jgi:predicted PurR-regulated permease PerM